MVSEQDCIRRAGAVLAASDEAIAQMTPREQAEAAWTPTSKHTVEEIEDLPNLIDGLQRHGYAEDDIAAILGGNYLRVLGTILPDKTVI